MNIENLTLVINRMEPFHFIFFGEKPTVPKFQLHNYICLEIFSFLIGYDGPCFFYWTCFHILGWGRWDHVANLQRSAYGQTGKDTQQINKANGKGKCFLLKKRQRHYHTQHCIFYVHLQYETLSVAAFEKSTLLIVIRMQLCLVEILHNCCLQCLAHPIVIWLICDNCKILGL